MFALSFCFWGGGSQTKCDWWWPASPDVKQTMTVQHQQQLNIIINNHKHSMMLVRKLLWLELKIILMFWFLFSALCRQVLSFGQLKCNVYNCWSNCCWLHELQRPLPKQLIGLTLIFATDGQSIQPWGVTAGMWIIPFLSVWVECHVFMP